MKKDKPTKPVVKAEDSAEFAEMKVKLEKAEALNAKLAKEKLDSEVANFSAELVKNGNIMPAHKDSVVKLLNSLGSLDTADFAEGDNPQEQLKSFLKSITSFDFKEKSGENEPKPSVNFNAPRNVQVEAKDLDKLAKIEKYAKDNKVSLADASMIVGE